MDEGLQGLIIFISIAIICSLVIHYYSSSYLFSTVVAAFFSSIIFQIADYFHRGYFDKFALVAFIFGGLYAWGISLIVGLPFKLIRKKSNGDNIT
jgi:small basic protein